MKRGEKERELVSLCEAVDEHNMDIKEKVKELCSVQVRVEKSELDFPQEG